MSMPQAGVALVAKDIRDYLRDLDRANKGIADFGDRAERSARGLTSFERIAGGAFERVGHTVVDLAAQMGAAVVSAAGDTINAAGDFESGLNRFEAVAGSTFGAAGKDIGAFSDLFLQMGADTQFSAAQAQEAAIALAKGGRDAGQVYAELSDTLALAAAGELDLAAAADITAKQLGVWGDTGVTAAQVANRLAQAANASTVDVDDLALGLANVGGVAKVAGLNFDETVAVLAEIAPGFSSASDAGTSFKAFLNNLQPTTDPATKAMQELGLYTAETGSAFYDAEGQFIGMEQAAGLLHDATKDLSEAERSLALETIFGSDAQRAAAIIAERGADGYRDMASSMDAAGSATEQAAKRNQGYNFAMESLLGSLETFQIIAGSKVLPVLTMLIQDGLIPGVNAATEFAQTLPDLTTLLAGAGGIISGTVIPAASGLTAALIAYGIVQLTQAIPATIALIPQLIAQAAAMGASAAATLAAIAPYAMIALAIGGVVKAYQDFTDKVKTGAQALLESKPWWTESTAAMESYGAATGEARAALEPFGRTIELLRVQIQGELEDLARRKAMGLVSEEQYGREIAVIQEHRNGLIAATAAYQAEEQALIAGAAAKINATTKTQELQQAEVILAEQTELTVDELKKLEEEFNKVFEAGTKALGELTNTHAAFVSDWSKRQTDHEAAMAELVREKAEAQTDDQQAAIDKRIAAAQAGFEQQRLDAAVAYAEQAALQRQALGEQLLAYIENQRQMRRIGDEEAAALRDKTVEHFGIMQDSTALLFGEMATTVDSFASGAITSADDVGAAWQRTEDKAVDLKEKADRLKDQYVMEIIADADQAGADIDDVRQRLAAVPARVNSEIVITETTIRRTIDEDGHGGRGGRAIGGPISANSAYLVGERGPEAIFPSRSGYVATARQTEALAESVGRLFGLRSVGAIAGAGQIAGRSGVVNNANTATIYIDARGMGDVRGAVEQALTASSYQADVRIRAT